MVTLLLLLLALTPSCIPTADTAGVGKWFVPDALRRCWTILTVGGVAGLEEMDDRRCGEGEGGGPLDLIELFRVCLEGEGLVMEVEGTVGGDARGLPGMLTRSGDESRGVEADEAGTVILDSLARIRTGPPLPFTLELGELRKLPAVLDVALVRRILEYCGLPGNEST